MVVVVVVMTIFISTVFSEKLQATAAPLSECKVTSRQLVLQFKFCAKI